MSKLWILHRQSSRCDALAHLSGLAPPDLVCGSPSDPKFENASPPAAVLVGAGGDFERELDFLHRHQDALAGTRRFFLISPEDADEVRRLFAATDNEILDAVPSRRSLRALILSAVSHRNAATLLERRDRDRVAHRFSRWFGEASDVEIPGLFRALDPALSPLPLLVRGAPGSGRTLLARYAELFRTATGPSLRLAGREIRDATDITSRLNQRHAAGLSPARTIWIDEVDACSPSVQRALSEWIRFGAAPGDTASRGATADAPLRWVATAGPGGLKDGLETNLEQAFAPLEIMIPALIDDPDALAGFATRVSADWTERVGGVPRRLAESAFAALEAHAWTGDRAAVEALLRTTFANTTGNPDALQGDDFNLAEGSIGTEGSIRAKGSIGAEGSIGTEGSLHAAGSPEGEEFDLRAGPRGGELGAVAADRGAPSEGAGFLDDLTEDLELATRNVAASQPTRDPFPNVPDESSADIEDFERAFLEGLPSPGPTPDLANETPSSALSPSPDRPRTETEQLDPSAQFSDETFEIARTSAPGPPNINPGNDSWRRLARSLSHEIRNPLTSIRTFTELLPDHFEDESFRERFTELVGRDVAHINEVVSRLADAAATEKLEAAPVDVSGLLERLLDARRDEIAEGRLLVLRELERDAPIAWADPHALEVALAGLLDRALAALPERGDLFVATRRIDRSADGEPRLRILLRHRNPNNPVLAGAGDGGLEELSSAANVLEYVLAETVVEASGGSLTIDSTDAQETLILVDLRTPA